MSASFRIIKAPEKVTPYRSLLFVPPHKTNNKTELPSLLRAIGDSGHSPFVVHIHGWILVLKAIFSRPEKPTGLSARLIHNNWMWRSGRTPKWTLSRFFNQMATRDFQQAQPPHIDLVCLITKTYMSISCRRLCVTRAAAEYSKDK